MKCVVVLSRIGKVAAAATAATLIIRFAVKEIVMIGTAGSVNPDLNIGDIVIGSSLIQHDVDASPLFPRYQIPLLGISSFFPSENISQRLANACNGFLTSSSLKQIQLTSVEFGISFPKISYGQIVSGDCFIANHVKMQQLRKEFPLADAVEMEGAALAQVCYENNVPFAIVRIISDVGNSMAAHDFQKFVKSVASIYSKEILSLFLAPVFY